MTLKEVRQALKSWGRFWAEKEKGLGFASISITATMMEVGALGVSSRSDKHLFSHGSEGLYVPDHIRLMDMAIDTFLRVEERQLVRAVYVQKRQLTAQGERVILRIENLLAQLIR